MFFESKHSIKEAEFEISHGSKLTFPLHVHGSFEFFAQVEGKTKVVIDGKEYILDKGTAVLIFPFQLHSYDAIEEGKFEMCIFSPDIVMDFYQNKKSLLPTDNSLPYSINSGMLENLFQKKAYAYRICGEFEMNRTYCENQIRYDHNCIVQLLFYADKHYNTSCLLRDASEEIGYDYAYVSKLFKKKIGMSFRSYVNALRIQKSLYLLKHTKDGITDIASKCGFDSLRAFDREFKSRRGITPLEYRKKR